MAQDIIWFGRPTPKAYDIPYKPHQSPSNPVLRGLPLSIAASLIANSPFLQRIFWSNAGFGSLRNRQALKDIDARYEPTVIKSHGLQTQSRTGEDYLAAISGEDWTLKAPKEGVLYSVLDYHEAYKSGKVTPLQVVEALLPLVRRDGEGGKHAVAFLETKAEVVREAARKSTERWREGRGLGVLDGVVMAVKDEEDLTGYRKSLGSKLDWTNKDDVTSYCVQQWLDAGAICIGKTTMHELGLDTTNNNPNFGTPRNPNHPNYYCGGSSGGSAYAVAAGLVPFAMGNDGGGSIRIPAAYCGLYGLKPSHARVSIRPTASLAKSTGVAGPIAANMVDLEVAYRIMAKPDELDPDSRMFVEPGSVNVAGKERKRVLGVFREWFDRADGPIKEACHAALDYLASKLGCEIVDISIPMIHEGQLAHAMTILAEISSGISSLGPLTAPNKVLLSVGSSTPAPDLLQAQKLRALLMSHLSHLYTQHPGLIIVTPTTPNLGWRINEADLKYGCSDGNTSIRNMEYVWLANFSGCPAISVPVGWLEGDGGTAEGRVPVGLMGMGEWGDEEGLMAFGYDVEGYVHDVLEGGRVRPKNWEDMLGLAREAE